MRRLFAAAASMPLPLACEVVNKTVELVESRGLYPRQQAEYDQAKAFLLAAFDGPVYQGGVGGGEYAAVQGDRETAGRRAVSAAAAGNQARASLAASSGVRPS